MNDREWFVLNAVNIATTRYRRPGNGYEATAEQIAEVFNFDDRLNWHGMVLGTRQVGETLKYMAQGWPRRHQPLVEKIDSRRWHLTDAGARVLNA